jgi:hypothetical protein
VAKTLIVEPDEAADAGPCECCGGVTRRAWGFVCSPERAVAAYVVQWAVGRVPDHGAMFDLILGPRGEGTSPADRVLVALDYRLTDTGPAFMVVDAAGRGADNRGIVRRALSRAEVVGQPVAGEAFAVADAVLAQDGRIAELLGNYRLLPPRKPRRRGRG